MHSKNTEQTIDANKTTGAPLLHIQPRKMSLILLFKSSMDDCGADLWSVDCRFSSHSACPLALPHVAPGSYRLVPLTAVSECAYEWVKRSETVRHFGPSKKAVKHFLSVVFTKHADNEKYLKREIDLLKEWKMFSHWGTRKPLQVSSNLSVFLKVTLSSAVGTTKHTTVEK